MKKAIQKKAIKLMADYGCDPLWWVSSDAVGAVDPAELPLKLKTIQQLKRWSLTYDATLNQDYPPDSGFASETDAQAFEQEGMRLWRQLAEELAPTYDVAYFSEQRGQLFAQTSQRLEVSFSTS